ncbi:Hypothetical predicted protein, partial [Pelobates cultripes]
RSYRHSRRLYLYFPVPDLFTVLTVIRTLFSLCEWHYLTVHSHRLVSFAERLAFSKTPANTLYKARAFARISRTPAPHIDTRVRLIRALDARRS